MSNDMFELYRKCRLCPRKCSVDRISGNVGICGMTSELYAARAALHMWEEPCISGTRGSGTVFFSGCSLKCVFCQNHAISSEKKGYPITTKRLSEIFLNLEKEGANNINLVTAAHFAPHVVSALIKAKDRGMKIPVVYNSSGYESVETLRLFEGLVDVYLPDMKYVSREISKKYSGAPDYFNAASLAIHEMYRQVGEPVFAGKGDVVEEGIMKRGVIVRHLILPTCTDDSREVVAYLHSFFGDKIYISIMNQYTPVEGLLLPAELTHGITEAEYDKVVYFAEKIGVKNGYIQEGGTVAESFIPGFNGEGIV